MAIGDDRTPLPISNANGSYLVHVTSDGDRWDLLAARYYGDALRYEPIVRANPLVPIAPVLDAGLVLQVPVLVDDADATLRADVLPPWKR